MSNTFEHNFAFAFADALLAYLHEHPEEAEVEPGPEDASIRRLDGGTVEMLFRGRLIGRTDVLSLARPPAPEDN